MDREFYIYHVHEQIDTEFQAFTTRFIDMTLNNNNDTVLLKLDLGRNVALNTKAH